MKSSEVQGAIIYSNKFRNLSKILAYRLDNYYADGVE